jgi:hypothetical protein
MIAEEVEFQISQYVDGTLSTAEMKYVDGLVQSDPQAAKVLAEYRRLNGKLATLRTAPAIKWDRLAAHISNEIDNDENRADQPAVAGRIGFFQSARVRIAAAVLLAGTAAIVARYSTRSNPAGIPTPAPTLINPTSPTAITDVIGPQAEVAKGAPVQDVSVGPSPSLANNSRYAEDVIGHGPPKVVILGRGLEKPVGSSPLH